MPTQQTKKQKDRWMAQTTGSAATTMEGPEYGFRCGIGGKRWLQPHMGGSQQVVKNEAFSTMSRRYKWKEAGQDVHQ
jgi:hypothetical protein